MDGEHVMLTNYPVNPRIRAYGKARIDLAIRLNNATDWDEQWKPPSNPFPFTWGESWKHCIEYRVDDFAAEVGFFIDILGFSINALDSSYAMFTSPQHDFYFAIVPTTTDEVPASPDAFRLQFMVRDVNATYQELLRRGIAFELTPQPLCPASSIMIATFRTPNAIPVEIWGISIESPIPGSEMKSAKNLAEVINSNRKDEHADDEAEDDDELDDGSEDDGFDDDGHDEDIEEDEESDEEQEMDEPDEEEVEDDDYGDDIDEEEGDEDEYDEDDDYDEEEYEIEEDGDDGDNLESDEYSSSTINEPNKSHVRHSFSGAQVTPSNSTEKPASSQQTRLLEYVDLESA
jgi:catechol 2,3-dioxygenase-like lactoylglutathione lyase family enzyme